ncbi:MAG: DRTGG domain-containing protein [Chloroflexota bacterium]
MTAVYVCSTEARAGKTMLAISLARYLQRSGLSVGYVKPVTSLNEGESIESSDAGFAKVTLGLTEPLDLIAPVQITAGELRGATSGSQTTPAERFRAAYDQIALRKDIVIVEGGDNLSAGTALGLSGPEVVAALSAESVLVAWYRPDHLVATINNAVKYLGQAPLGILVNNIPATQERFWASIASDLRRQNGGSMIASLPQMRSLMAVSVRELVEHLHGAVLCRSDELGRPVESVMIGTINHEDAKSYFERRANKAVVTAVGRPDMQLAALATPTSCLVLAGRAEPDPYVLSKAIEVGVPIVRVDANVVSVVESMQSLFDSARFRQVTKVAVADRLLAERVDLEALCAGLGVSRQAT